MLPIRSLDQIAEMMMEARDVDAAPILATGPIAPLTGGGKAGEPPGRRHSVHAEFSEVM